MPAPSLTALYGLVGPNEDTPTINTLVNAINVLGASSGNPPSFQVQSLTASGAIGPNATGMFIITKAGVAAMTLAAPAVTTSDGNVIEITSNTAFAHTVTATGLFQTGTATVNLATFAAFAGASIRLMAFQGKWNVMSVNAVVLS